MTLDYYAGKAMTGTEKRGRELDYDEMGLLLSGPVYPGTFNVQLTDVLPLHKMTPQRINSYCLYICGVSTSKMIRNGDLAVPGWVIRVDGEQLPGHFVEIVSIFNLRKELKMEKWPSFAVEIGLNLGNC